MRRNVGIILILFLLIYFFRELYSVLPPGLVSSAMFTLLAGFAILTAFFTGKIFSRFSMPRIVGYLIIGIIFGPGILHIFTHSDIGKLDLITQVALGLITISAGRELRIKEIFQRKEIIGKVIISHLLLIPIILAIPVYFFFKLPVIIAILTALILTTASPAVPLAMINEYGIKGIFPQLVLSILILRDVLIIFIFALVASFVGGEAGIQPLLLVLLSLIIGFIVGYLFNFLLKYKIDYPFIFLLILLIIMYQVSEAYKLNFILMTVMVGFAVENFSTQGENFLQVIESGSLPLYAIFFSLAGASLELDILYKIGLVALIIVITRLLMLFFATYLPLNKEGAIKYYLFSGFVPQAGVSIGLAILLSSLFPAYKTIGNLIIASAVINEIMGPFFFKWGLVKAGSENVPDVKLH